ncbi:MAG TPA: Ig-like domain-containing protein [Kofleriaceae bacterium]|nr:Ig-like domain-containing protein [Kofleriaceae bacterium]
MKLRPVYRSSWVSSGVLAGFAMALSCGGSTAHRDLKVMSFTPEGAIEKAESIVIRFDKPVVEAGLVSKPADPSSVKVTPAFAWKGYWQDTRTLVIDPSGPLAPSTKYDVTLTGELAKRTAAFQMSFVHRPLAVEGLWGGDAETIAPDGDLPLAFNQPVRALDVAMHCRLLDGEQQAIALVGKVGEPSAHLTVKPAKVLASGTHYTLRCDGLTGAGGNTPLASPYELAVETRPTLSVTSIEPDGQDVPADEVNLTVTFSTPMDLDAARKAVRSVPPIPGIDNGWLDDDGTAYHVTADLDTQTKYTITVANAVDKFGQKLVKTETKEFTTGDARPRISMERGIYALEASAKGYPVWTRNITKYGVECAAIPKERIVQVLTTDMNYDPWGGNDDDKPIDWKKLHVKARSSTMKPAVKNKWKLDELALGKLCGGGNARGMYLAEISSDEIVPDQSRGWLSPRRNRVLANVTDMGILIKAGTASGLVWVTSLATGQPIAGAKVSVYSPQGKLVHTGTTTGDGIVMIPGSAILKAQPAKQDPEEGEFEEWDSYRSQRLIAIVEKANDLAVVDGNWANGIQLWNFGVAEDRRGGATKIRGFIQSDRGLYRPGEEVHFKGIARAIKQGRPPSVPSGKVEIEVEDSRGQSVMTTTQKLSSFGGFAFDLKLREDANVGDYYVRAKLGDQVFRERFSVEEFRPATFEVKLGAAKPNPLPGEPLSFALDARYLFGSPAASAGIEWSLRKRPHRLRFTGFDAYTFSSDPHDWYWYEPTEDYGEFVAEGTATTDAQGHAVIASQDPATEYTGPVDYILSTNVTDSADQTMGKSTVVTAHKTSFYLGMHANEFVQAVGMPFGVNLVALKPDGSRIGAKAKLTMTRIEGRCTWSEVGMRSYYHCDQQPKVVLERAVTIANAGSHTERINPTEPGEYVIQISAKDDRGNDVAAASSLWVIGKGEAFWSGDEGARMTLIASKPAYKAGETARLVAQANLKKPTALITIERDGVIEAKVKQLGSPSEGIELPIVDAWAPNVYAGVALVSGRQGAGDKNRPQFKMGLVELKVAAEHKQLDVAVALDQQTVKPGDKVSGKIKVTHGGKPVKAEVSLSAADEGILQLISYETPNPMKTFYASYGLGVDAGTNWNRIARLADPSSGDPDEGGDSGSTQGGQRIRSKFVSSAYWSPMLVTDGNGEIAFSFTAPDNLTAFRLMAVAADTADRFGAGEQRLTVNKPVMAAPALPRFLRSGDAASVGIVIHNHTDQKGAAIVTAKADGATLDVAQQTVDVPANGSVRVRFAAKASDNAAATFEFGIRLGKDSDAVRVTVPIDRPRVIDNRLVVEQRLGKAGSWTGTLGVGGDVLRKESELAITIDRTGVGELGPGLRSLVEYPYGCLEQTMSRFVPLVAARDLANVIDDPSLRGTKADQFIRAGTEKVIRHQQGDGHFSLWPQSQTYPHLTAYALWGLTIAQRAGQDVPYDVFENGMRALREWANKPGTLKPNGDGATIAMGAYVMALRGHPDASLNARLYDLRAGLPKWGQAFLLRTLKLAKADPKQIADVQKLVEANVVVANGKGLVHESKTDDQLHYMNSDVRATAMTLAALLEVDPNHKLVDPLVAGLKSQRTKQGTWVSTQENLWSLVALAEYGRRSTAGETNAVVKVGGKQVLAKKLVGTEIATLRVPVDQLTSEQLEIRVDQPANVTARVREARVDALAPVANGFTLERAYLDANGKPVTSFKAGEMVTVKLTLGTTTAQPWVAMVDPLPAGFEVVNPKLAAGSANPQKSAVDQDPWAKRFGYATWDHEEMRDDRVQWFADNLPQGHYELTYQARATIDGTFTAMPAHVEAMYTPDVRARTSRSKVTVTK